MGGESSPQTRLAEVIGILAMATDLGIGLPIEHAIRTTLLSLELGRRVGLSGIELVDLFYLTQLRMLGCTAGSRESAEFFVDEVAFARDTQHLDYGDPEGFGRWVMQSFGADRAPDERQRMMEKLFSYTPETRRGYIAGHCEVAQMLATRLGFSGAVIGGLALVFERWDGSGVPNGVRGTEQPAGVRVMTLCNEIEVHHRLHGIDGAVAMARQRSGAAFEPELVDTFCNNAAAILEVIEQPSPWDRLLRAEPEPHRFIDDERRIAAAGVMGDFADLKSVHLTGHSSSVARLATAAARRIGTPDGQRRDLHAAALAHDLGRVTVSTSIWDKPAALNESEWEAVRLHPYYSERMLGRAASFAAVARIAGMHHERADGSGYHRGSGAAAQSDAGRLLAATDAHVAMREARAHRPALEPEHAGAELRRMAAEDQLDPAAVNAVLAAAGDTGPRVRRRWPAELTDREVDVLRRIASGSSIQETAAALHLAPKTVDFHVQNIYSKAGVTTRAAVTLFAIQNGLLEA